MVVVKFDELNDTHAGETIVILGNSPVLKQYQLRKLFLNYPVFTCNRWFLWNREHPSEQLFPAFYTAADHRMFKYDQDGILEIVMSGVSCIFPKKHPHEDYSLDFLGEVRNEVFLYTKLTYGRVSPEQEEIGLGATTINPMIKLSAQMGFTTMLFLGVDMQNTTLPYDHFSENYVDINKEHGAPHLEDARKTLRNTISKYAEKGIKFECINPESWLIGNTAASFSRTLYYTYK